MSNQNRVVGQTRDVGFEIGARRTLPLGLEAAWQLLLSPAGQQTWLGAGPAIDFAKGTLYQRADGATGEVRVFSPHSHLRMTWQPQDWPDSSTIQVRVHSHGDRTVISFHQEHLPDAHAREARQAHFVAALDALERLLAAGQ